MAQWRICLSVQGTWDQSLIWEDPVCPEATKTHVPQLLNLCCRAQEPQLLRPRAATSKPGYPRVHAPQQNRPRQWETRAQWLERNSLLLQLEKSPHSNDNPAQPKINICIYIHIYVYIYMYLNFRFRIILIQFYNSLKGKGKGRLWECYLE